MKEFLESEKDTPLETMAGFFEARIDDYEQHMSRWADHYCRVAGLVPQNTESLLDLGCGTGLELDGIYKIHPSINTTGVDLSTGMLNKLRLKYSERNLTLVCADYYKYGFGKECFDAVTAFETLHHADAAKKSGLFLKVYGCLKPGGVFIECDYIATSQIIEDMACAELSRKRKRDKIADGTAVHFDTPLTLGHELAAIKSAGDWQSVTYEFLPEDDHTVIIVAKK